MPRKGWTVREGTTVALLSGVTPYLGGGEPGGEGEEMGGTWR